MDERAVTDPNLVERLAGHRLLGGAPREQLEWLAAHGKVIRLEPGGVLSPVGEAITHLYVVLSGHSSIRVDRGAGPRKVMEWRAGDVGGLLPYSRLTAAPGNVTIEEPTEILAVSRECFTPMAAHCPDLTAILVHVMVDRARRFATSDVHDEKMISLGRLAAGLAHELNNPASAVARTAKELRARLSEMEASALALGAMSLTPEQLDVIGRAREQCRASDARNAETPLDRADREQALADWLERKKVRSDVAELLAETTLTVADLERLAKELSPDSFELALRSIGASQRARLLAAEIETASARIHSLVAAIKGFTYMDQERTSTPVAIGKGLADTMAVLGAKARDKSVTVEIRVADDLPAVEGFGGELNQVWVNLIDNAIDAAPRSGKVEVTATRENRDVVVRVVDDGPGVPAELMNRIFDPFFTTKPMGQGTGLGLDIARRLVRQHDGYLEVDSRPGRTEFRVILPAG